MHCNTTSLSTASAWNPKHISSVSLALRDVPRWSWIKAGFEYSCKATSPHSHCIRNVYSYVHEIPIVEHQPCHTTERSYSLRWHSKYSLPWCGWMLVKNIWNSNWSLGKWENWMHVQDGQTQCGYLKSVWYFSTPFLFHFGSLQSSFRGEFHHSK